MRQHWDKLIQTIKYCSFRKDCMKMLLIFSLLFFQMILFAQEEILDSTKKPVISTGKISFDNWSDPCNTSYFSEETVKGIQIVYDCKNSRLNGYNKKGRRIWSVNLKRKLDNQYINTLRGSESDYKYCVVFSTEEGGDVYMLNPKNGQIIQSGTKKALRKKVKIGR